jgi:hypothetical protein
VDAWSLGRTPSALEPPYQGQDLVIAGDRREHIVIDDAKYSHTTFVSCSFLDSEIKSGQFLDCVFVECYFRRTQFRATAFIGCKFINCNFGHVAIQSCDFKYSEFRGSAPPFSEMRHSAPPEPNLREALFSRMAMAADQAGEREEARAYRLAAISAQNEHLRAAVRSDSKWYREHYDLPRRAGALLTLFWHWFNKYLWGHGESAWRLLLSALIVVGAVFPLLFFFAREGLSDPAGALATGDYFWLSLSNFLLLDRLSEIGLVSTTSRALAAVQALSGIVFAGLYVTLLVKALLRR